MGAIECDDQSLYGAPGANRGVPGYHSSLERTEEVGKEECRCLGSVIAER